MARGVNKVILIGNLGNAPETRFTAKGAAITNASLATSRTYKDKNTDEEKEHTEWHRVVFFNRLGEIAGEYLKKGSKIYVEGYLRTTKWQDKDGHDRYTTEVVAVTMQMLDSRGDTESSHDSQQSSSHAPTSYTHVDNSNDIPFDDDIPF